MAGEMNDINRLIAMRSPCPIFRVPGTGAMGQGIQKDIKSEGEGASAGETPTLWPLGAADFV